MQLESLARGDPQCVIGIARGQLVLNQILLGCQHPAWNTWANHKRVGFLTATCPAYVSRIPILLLVNSRKLEELYLLLREMCGILCQFLSQLPPQVIALELDLLHLAPHTRP